MPNPEELEVMQERYDAMPIRELLAQEEQIQEVVHDLQQRASMIAKAILGKTYESPDNR